MTIIYSVGKMLFGLPRSHFRLSAQDMHLVIHKANSDAR